eukprot:jgi/Ulvmu1/9459/UM052_0027.1
MAAKDDADGGDFDTPVYRLVLFFLLILAIDTVWELIDEHVTHTIRKKQHKGLVHAWEQLKFEVMALGLVSLLLVVFEEYLLRICVDKANKDGYEDVETEAGYRRRLLAAKADCPDGKEPFWSSALIHKIHILIFLIAASHVIYAVASLTMSMLSMRRWQEYERTAQEGELLPLPTDQLQKADESKIVFGLRQTVRQFINPIDRPTYIALRRLFFERMPVDSSFNFADFVTDFLTEEFARVVKLEFLMWIIAIVWIAIPAGAYAGFWLTGGFFILSVIAGAKLHVIAMHLARQAYSLYFQPISSSGGAGGGDGDSASSDNASVRIGCGPAPAPQSASGGAAKQARGRLFRKSAVAVPQHTLRTARPLGEGVEVEEPASLAAATSTAEEPLTTVLEVPEEGRATRGTLSSERQRSGPMRRSHSASALLRMSDDKPGSPPGRGGVRLPDATSSDRSRQLSTALTTPAAGSPAPRTAAAAPAAPRRGGCLACVACGAPPPQRGRGRDALSRRSAQVKPWRDVDFKQLFWFGRPRLMLRVFQYAYFENALSLAVLAFAFWQHESSMFAGVVGDKSEVRRSTLIAACVFIGLDVALLVHSSCFVLPVYALTAAAANFDTPEGLLEFAKKRGIRPDIVEFLQETDPMTPELTPRMKAAPAATYGGGYQSPLRSPRHSDDDMLRLPPTGTVPLAVADAPDIAALRRASAGGPATGPEDPLPSSQSGPPVSAPRRNALSRMSAAPAVDRASPPSSEVRLAAPAIARPSLSRASCPVANQGGPRPTLSRPSASSNVAQPRQGLARPSLRRNSVVRTGADGEKREFARVPDAPPMPVMQRDIAHVQPSVEGLIQSMFHARLKELKDTAAASSGALTPRSPHSPGAGMRDTVLRRMSGGTAAAPPAAAPPASRPRVSLSRHSDMSAVLARQIAKAEDGGTAERSMVHKSPSAGALAGPSK